MADVKTGCDVGFCCPGADGAGIRPVPHAETQRVQHDGLARAGLSGNAGHTRIQIDLKVVDDGVVLNGEVGQHGVVRAWGMSLL